MSADSNSLEWGQPEEFQTSINSPDDEEFNRGLSSSSEGMSQSPFVRSFYDYPSTDVSSLLENQTNSYVQNDMGFESSSADNSSSMFENIPVFGAGNLNAANTSNRGAYNNMTSYEKYLYQQYGKGDDIYDQKESSIHSDISNELSSSIDQNDKTNGDQTNAETANDVPLTLESTRPSPTQTQILSMTQGIQPRINRPSITKVNRQSPEATLSAHLVRSMRKPSIQLPSPPPQVFHGLKTSVTEWMTGEVIERNFLSHASVNASKTSAISINCVAATTDATVSSSADQKNDKHITKCVNCCRELRVNKLVSLVSCPSCENVFPNSRADVAFRKM